MPLEMVSEEEETAKISNAGKRRRKWLAALLFSSLGGVLVGLTGLVISGLSLFNLIEKTSLANRIGTILIVVAFPLVLFSAHALDKIAQINQEKQNK